MRLIPRKTRIFSALVAVVLAVAGCGGGSLPDASAKPETLIIAMPADIDGFELMSVLTSTTRAWVGPNIVDTLGIYDFESKSMKPSLATEWTQTDDTHWTVTLRDAKFSNGDPVTAADAAASIDYAIKGRTPLYLGFLSTITGARALDDHRLEVTTAQLDPVFPRRLQYISVLPQSQLDPGVLTNSVIGSGPYKLANWDKGRSITLEANPEYWGTKPQFEKVEMIIRPEPNVRLSALQTNEAQLAMLLDIDQADRAPKSVSIPGQEVACFVLNTVGQTSGSIMQDVRVRQAINYAIDREAIANSLFAGKAQLPHAQLNPLAMAGTDPNLEDYPYDPDNARQLISEAGAQGKTVTIRSMYTRWQKSKELTEVVAGYLSDIGLKPNIVAVDYVAWQQGQTDATDGNDARADMSILYHGNEYFDSTIKTLANLQSRAADHGIWWIANPQIDQLADQISVEVDTGKRDAMMRQVWGIFKDQALALPLVAPEFTTGMSENLEYQPRPDEMLYLKDIGWK